MGHLDSMTEHQDDPPQTLDYHGLNYQFDDPPQPMRITIPNLFLLLLDLIFCLVAALFLGLACLALALKNRPIDDHVGLTTMKLAKLGPSIYPILFASLMSNSLRRIGRYRAERGVQISTLWQLMTSNSTLGPIVSQWRLRRISFLGLLLIFLWLLSPAGGQASLRVLTATNLTIETNHEIRYMDNGPLGNLFAQIGFVDGNDGELPITIRDAYIAALMQNENTKLGPRDVWGNVKIPRIESLNPNLADFNGWHLVDKTPAVESYSSLFGVPLVGLETLGQAKSFFTIENSYIDLFCPSVDSVSVENFTYGFRVSCTDCSSWSYDNGHYNPDTATARENSFLGPPFPSIADSGTANSALSSTRHIEFISATGNGIDGINAARAVCEVRQTLVEAQIRCEAKECAAVAVRQSETDHRSTNYTTFDASSALALNVISSASKPLFANQGVWGSSSSELFINNSNSIPTANGLSWNLTADTQVNLSTIPPNLFAVRASMLLNTVVQAYLAPTGFAGGFPTDFSLYGPPHIPADGLKMALEGSQKPPTSYEDASKFLIEILARKAPFVGASTNATVLRYIAVYTPDYPWALLLALSSCSLFITGFIGIVMGLRTFAPDVFDPVIGLTYDNPHVPLLAGRGPLDAGERGRLLKDLRLRLGESSVDTVVGKLVFGEMTHVEALDKERLYH